MEINDIPQGDVLLIAATNCPQHCDPALIRKGRFDVSFEIPLPGPLAREQILTFYLDKKDLTFHDGPMKEMVEATEGRTGSDLRSLISSIYITTIDRKFPEESYAGMSDEELIEEMEELDIDMEEDVRPHLREFVKTNASSSSNGTNATLEE